MTDFITCNQWWVSLILDSLAAYDCHHVVICPGNRDLPLMVGLVQDQRFRCYSHLDERSAAFRALGLCRASKQPTAVVTTSGSAVANCLPALCEAHATGDPLILLSADRPPQLQDSGAPQTMPQANIFEHFCAAQSDLGLPRPADAQGMLDRLSNALHQGINGPGPIHINIPFDEPLIGEETHAAFPSFTVKPHQKKQRLNEPAFQACLDVIAQAKQGLLVIGADNPLPPAVLHSFADRGWPIITDASENLRWSGLPTLVSTADLLCGLKDHPAKPDCIIRIGQAPLARPVWEWLQQQTCPVVRFDRQMVQKDFCHTSFVFAGKIGDFHPTHLQQLSNTIPPQRLEWTKQWMTWEEHTKDFLRNWLQTASSFNELSAAAMVCRHPSSRELHLQTANSLSVRYGNLFCSPEHPWQHIWTSRGVNGIDGTIGTAMGICEQRGALRLLSGDLAIIHDAPALPALSSARLPLHLIVLNNGGGRIFDTLRGAQSTNGHQLVQDFLRTPQQCDLVLLAESCGIQAERISTLKQLDDCLKNPVTAPRLSEIVLADQSPAQLLADLKKAYEALFAARG